MTPEHATVCGLTVANSDWWMDGQNNNYDIPHLAIALRGNKMVGYTH